jgi:hypothetical protein
MCPRERHAKPSFGFFVLAKGKTCCDSDEEVVMETWEWIVIGAAAALVLLLVLALVRIRRRRSHLQERFGPEYHRAVSSSGTEAAEKRLGEVEREHAKLDIRPLPPAARERYLDEWRQAEARFVSDPRESARAAERIVERVLEERGYPVDDDAERRAAVVAVDHADIADRYRHGHAMLSSVDGAEGTENLRKAIVDFRSVLEELLESDAKAA